MIRILLNINISKRWIVLGLLISLGIVGVMSEEAKGNFSSYSIAEPNEQLLKGKRVGPNIGEEEKLLAADAPGFQSRINDLKNPNPSVRLEAVKTLGFFRDKRAVQFIIPLMKDPDKQVRRAAVEALGRINDTQGIVALIPALKDIGLSDAAFNALWETNDPHTASLLVSAWKDRDCFFAQEKIKKLLVHLGKPSVMPLLAEVKDMTDFYREITGGDVFRMVIEMKKDAVEPLIAVLGDENKNICSRFIAARALGVIKDERAIEPLGAALKSGAVGLRKEANTALIDITNEDFQVDYNRYLEWWTNKKTKNAQ